MQRDHAKDAGQRPEHHNNLYQIDIHAVTFLTDTAVTLNSGSFEAESSLSATARLTRSFAS